MAVDKKNLTNIDNSQPVVYPNGHTQDNSGSDDGTPLNNDLLSDKFETWDKLMRLYGITFNNLPDNETNGFQFVEALTALASKNDFVLDITEDSGDLVIPIKLGFLKDNESIILKATVDKTTETDLKGSLDNVTKTITYIGDFKTGEYVRMINLTSSVILIRMVDADSIIGAKSSDFLASSSNNGLLSSSNYDRFNSVRFNELVPSTGNSKIVAIDTGQYSIDTSLYPEYNGVITITPITTYSTPLTSIKSFSYSISFDGDDMYILIRNDTGALQSISFYIQVNNFINPV